MISLGIDTALSKPIALASLDENGTLHTRKVGPFRNQNGAVRLASIRSAVSVVLSHYRPDVVVVETPFGRQSRGLTNSVQAQGVILEAAQATHPGALVLDLSPGDWKRWSVGDRSADKEAYIAHAQALGLGSEDEDLCAAACMAQAGMELLLAEQAREAA